MNKDIYIFIDILIPSFIFSHKSIHEENANCAYLNLLHE